MKEELKQMVREKVAAGAGLPVPAPRPAPLAMAAAVPVPVALADELIIEITGDSSTATLNLRPFEVSRLRGRFGRGPGFEQWVADRVRDLLVSFGGG